jgi:16S rRNA processing protein RimM
MKKILIGKIVNARGLKGELLLVSFTEPPEKILDYAQYYVKEGNSFTSLNVLNKKHYKGDRILFSLEGINSKEEADMQRGREIYVDAEELEPIKDEDEFFFHEAEGVPVYVGEKCIGTVVAARNFGSCDLLEVKIEGSKNPVYLPVLKEYLETFDLKNKKIVYRDIDDLL